MLCRILQAKWHLLLVIWLIMMPETTIGANDANKITAACRSRRLSCKPHEIRRLHAGPVRRRLRRAGSLSFSSSTSDLHRDWLVDWLCKKVDSQEAGQPSGVVSICVQSLERKSEVRSHADCSESASVVFLRHAFVAFATHAGEFLSQHQLFS